MLLGKYLYANISLELFCLALMSILLITSKKVFAKSQSIKYLRWAFVDQIIVMSFDLVSWIVDGHPGKAFYYIIYIANLGYFQSQIYASIIWGKYVHYQVTKKIYTQNQNYVFSTLPQALMAVFLLTNHITGYMFSFDVNNHYSRGPVGNVASVMVMLYLASISGWALYKGKQESSEQKKNECRILFMFAIPPLIGGIMQTLFYGICVIWPMTCIGMLMVYITKTQDEISQDALTGLNNRGNLDRYLNERIKEKSEKTVLVLMDVDKFKEINDRFGHDTGDEALKVVSKCIKETFGTGKNFLSRYGGDEFVAIIPGGNEIAAQAKIDKFSNAIKNINDTDRYLFKLSVSCGYAVYPNAQITDTKSFISEADKQMYEVKESHHVQSAPQRKLKKRVF